MTLADILRQTRMNRATYDALMARGTIPFMRRVPGQSLGAEQLFALQTFLQLRKLGLEARLAGETVNASYGQICDFVAGSHSPGRIGVATYQDERGNVFAEHLGWPNEANRGLRKIGELSLDFEAVRGTLDGTTADEAA